MCVCVYVILYVLTPLSVLILFLSLSSLLYQSLFSPSVSFSALLLPCTAWGPRVRFPIVGPAVSPLPDLLEMLPLLVSRAGSGSQGLDVLPLSREALTRLVATGVLARPNLLANLVDGAQVGVVHQLHEVPVPQLLICHRGAASTAGIQSDGGVQGQIGDGGGRRRHYFQSDA